MIDNVAVQSILEQMNQVGVKPGQVYTGACLFSEHDACKYKKECSCKCHRRKNSDDNETK